MVKVLLSNTVLAESDATIVVENNYYFPPASIKKDYFKGSATSSVCPWKGTASYYSADVNGNVVEDIAWYYPNPSEKASHIKDYVAFYKNKVEIKV